MLATIMGALAIVLCPRLLIRAVLSTEFRLDGKDNWSIVRHSEHVGAQHDPLEFCLPQCTRPVGVGYLNDRIRRLGLG